MKKKLIAIFVALASASAQSVPDSQQEALRIYPALRDSGSALNLRFVARVKSLRAGNDPLLQSADWPLTVARQVATELGIVAALPAPDIGIPYVDPRLIEKSKKTDEAKGAAWSHWLTPEESRKKPRDIDASVISVWPLGCIIDDRVYGLAFFGGLVAKEGAHIVFKTHVYKTAQIPFHGQAIMVEWVTTD